MQSTTTHETYRDISGFAAFNTGDAGATHVASHELLDSGRFEEGYRFLGDWLQQHTGSGSDWVHLQWHMAVFELSTGRLGDAFDRFEHSILPAVSSNEALTDGPSLLWRFLLSGTGAIDIDWSAVRGAAMARHSPEGDPYVELHNVLALAGARDLAILDEWLDGYISSVADERCRALLPVAWALRSFASGDYQVAAQLLRRAVDGVSSLGGSNGQNVLFVQICDEASLRARRERSAYQRAA